MTLSTRRPMLSVAPIKHPVSTFIYLFMIFKFLYSYIFTILKLVQCDGLSDSSAFGKPLKKILVSVCYFFIIFTLTSSSLSSSASSVSLSSLSSSLPLLSWLSTCHSHHHHLHHRHHDYLSHHCRCHHHHHHFQDNLFGYIGIS